jgi:hypothetical protein
MIEIFKSLFESDADKVIQIFDRYTELSINSDAAADESFVYNHRKVRFYKVENDHAFTVWIYDKQE